MHGREQRLAICSSVVVRQEECRKKSEDNNLYSKFISGKCHQK